MTLRLFCALVLGLTLGSFAVGCSDSHENGANDSGILLPDTNIPDAGMRTDGGPDAGPPPPMCGNGRLEAGESCDDHNVMAGDGCSPTCMWEARCGDMHLDPGEVCDDGNNLSGDGCRSDCLSNETCGNGIIDYARGEVCDGAGCSPDCHALLTCGNMVVDPGEQCDNDLNMPPHRWDGCGADCRTERSMVLHDTAFAGATMGCDYSGDGMPDNAFATALGSGLGLLNMLFMGGGGGGAPTILLSYMGLDDATGANDPDLRTAWLQGQDADMDPSNNYTGMGTFTVAAASLAMDGSPMTSLQTSIMSNALRGGPEDLDLNLGFFPLTLNRAFLRGTTAAMSGELWSLDGAFICGVVQSQTLSFVNQSLIESFGGGGGFMITIPPPCDGSMTESTLVDWLIGGARIAIINIRPTSPDVDLDGDGLETFEVVRRNAAGTTCQAVVTACIDGDGTRVEGRNCYNDRRFQDGYSAALSTNAIRAVITGVR